MFTKILIALALLYIPSAVWAAGPEPSEDSVMALLEIMNMHKSLNLIGAQMDSIMQQAVDEAAQGHPLSSVAQNSADRCRADLHVAIREDLSWDKMMPIYVAIYQKAFTQEEINALTAFYKTPLGQKIVVKLPEAMKNAEEQTMEAMRPMMQRIREMQQEIAQEVKSAK